MLQKPRMVAHRLRNVASALDGCIRVQISEQATSYITREYGRAGTATQWRKRPCISEYFPTDLAHSGPSMRCHVGLGLLCNSTGCLQHVAYVVFQHTCARRVLVKSFPCVILAVLDL